MRVEDLAEAVSLSLSAVRFHLDRLIADGLVRTSKEPRQTPGRPRVMYQAVPEEAVDDGAAYRHLAILLADELAGRGGAAAGEAAGRAWARQVLDVRQWAVPEPDGDLAEAADGRHPGGGRGGNGYLPAGPSRAGFAPARGAGAAAKRRAQEAEALPDCLNDLMGVLEDGGFSPQVVDGGWAVELHRCPYADLMPDQSEVVCSVHRGLMQSLPELAGNGDRVRLEPMPDGASPCVVHFVR